mmetsp:Transcript_32768/g.29642  ORF Transcript_32768/g.29642 Transcript_32768/m.29642 type:complete len:289 (+) Transcript_32768:917-1783(+)|eukprot:CAMPEP_0114579198 /NCGR_PEP_ID=MMETSP0125-20121206/3617_1 /TAXON_ID=485358 ORGANISM="Aristerostoma sp., Strain ATCC 50986" /NCGR_SAMPLE_ID=MMETSP0125 /ASSEMBLY_ACC=CAM_ASM_000245 /LENGTH=288 /DNA_ID=CAMNT_0001769787 /DNA_START=1203 /DNA_END=2069 /DNA_ORIENTATION=-
MTSIFLFVFGFFIVRREELKEIKRFKKEKLSPERYTVRVKGIPKVSNIYLMMDDLIDHFRKYFGGIVDTKVADINLLVVDDIINKAKKKIGTIMKQINACEYLIDKAQERLDDDDKENKEFIDELYYRHYEYKRELEAAKKELAKAELETPKQIKYVFVTFNSPRTAEYLINEFKDNNVYRLFGLDKEEWRYFKLTRIIVKAAPPPTNLQWKNFGLRKSYARILKICLQLLLTAFVIAGFYMLMYYQIEKANYLTLLDPVPKNCPENVTQDQVAQNWYDKDYLKCYCD